jgi:hypothetical protein
MPPRRTRESMYSSTILHFGNRLRWVASFTPRPLYPWGKSHRPPMNMRLDGFQSRSRRRGEEKNISFFCRELHPGRSASSPSIHRLSHPGFHTYTQRHGDLISLLSTSWEGSWLKNTYVSEEHRTRICGMRWHESWWNMRWSSGRSPNFFPHRVAVHILHQCGHLPSSRAGG